MLTRLHVEEAWSGNAVLLEAQGLPGGLHGEATAAIQIAHCES
jgi:hypothetical protein